ncbi:MAG: hypothetical protein ABI614_26920 [Planctomycetota bacterium]
MVSVGVANQSPAGITNTHVSGVKGCDGDTTRLAAGPLKQRDEAFAIKPVSVFQIA